MLNFNSFFNQWRSQPSNGLSDLIDSPGITLGRLLDQDQFISEYKSGNLKVAEFMKYQRYEELLQFVTVVGPADDKKRSYKFPLTACELLSMENSNANSVELFLPERPILIQTKIIEDVEEEVETEIQQPVQNGENEQKPQALQNNNNTAIHEEGKTSEEAEVNVYGDEKNSQQVKQTTTAPTNEQQKQKSEAVVTEPVQKRKVKVINKITKKVQKITQEEKPALIVKLLSYFSGEINYTLAGYVSKILGFLLTKKPSEFFKYVLQERMMHQIINHAESRSVGELIVKILTHQSVYSLDLRQLFYKQLLARLSAASEVYVISNLSAYVCEIIEKIAANLKSNNKIVELSNIFFSLQVITQVIKNVMNEQESVSVYNAPILLTYLTNVPFTIPEDATIIEEFKKLGQLFIEKSCQKLNVEHKTRPKLGGGRIKLLEILRFVLKENLLNSKQTVAATKQFFPILISLMKQYEMNNVLHNEVIKIVEIALLQPEGSNLNNSILSQNVLLNFLYSETEEDKKIRAKDSIYKSRKGYIAHVINLAVKLRELSERNTKIKQLTQTPEFSTLYGNFIERETFNSKKSLAGFTKKETKHQIMFQKEDIIAAHLTFFQKCPSAVFQPEPKPEQPVNIEHPDLVEELQKQLQDNLTVKPKQVESQTPTNTSKAEETVTEKQVEEEQRAEGRYWSTHLQYNIDDLINDL